MPDPSPSDLLDSLRTAAVEAGAAVLRHRAAGVHAEEKADHSPVTAADREAEAIVLRHLAAVAPGVPVVAEEEAAAGRIPQAGDRFFLVDPLDGTKEYVGGGDDFTVNIALIERGAPVLGVVYAPARARLFWGDVVAGEAWQATQPVDGAADEVRRIACTAPAGGLRAVASKSHGTPATESYLTACKAGARLSVGSSLKFVLVAAGEADIYPRAGPTMEWDTAAGDAVLRAAGGMTFDLDGAPLAYGKPHFFNPGFVAAGRCTAVPLRDHYPDAPTVPGVRA
ncbi:3'(2'),5'-bisphosphate nucleotidase CysQ [Sphingomonas nostoxanthinifaciens]|uniref:3'(2'),5'-bisphosphate nucleotidase CysQ n=1 Tax=Sphingomonas nostoxanthinifaciens TaxID=2872652 RepID=UPI001CC1D788|nr:3'(2'),5'-bisphosphate nucleotidase CysQ [Sphingomonas nostoxanthinifaciens]UAK24904.1 3'(2'),5'-bisphosphate nucleotidase CysQ [Sphingomonas nostoxanthinifaciens]